MEAAFWKVRRRDKVRLVCDGHDAATFGGYVGWHCSKVSESGSVTQAGDVAVCVETVDTSTALFFFIYSTGASFEEQSLAICAVTFVLRYAESRTAYPRQLRQLSVLTVIISLPRMVPARLGLIQLILWNMYCFISRPTVRVNILVSKACTPWKMNQTVKGLRSSSPYQGF